MQFVSNKVFFIACMSLICLTGCLDFFNKKAAPTLIVINVLDDTFYKDCHIPGSVQIPMTEVAQQAQQWPKTTKLVVYCSNYSCTASTAVCRDLMKMGFEHVFDYKAGMAGWFQAGYPVEGPAKAEYLHMANEPFPGAQHGNVVFIGTEELRNLIEGNTVKK